MPRAHAHRRRPPRYQPLRSCPGLHRPRPRPRPRRARCQPRWRPGLQCPRQSRPRPTDQGCDQVRGPRPRRRHPAAQAGQCRAHHRLHRQSQMIRTARRPALDLARPCCPCCCRSLLPRLRRPLRGAARLRRCRSLLRRPGPRRQTTPCCTAQHSTFPVFKYDRLTQVRCHSSCFATHAHWQGGCEAHGTAADLPCLPLHRKRKRIYMHACWSEHDGFLASACSSRGSRL